MMPPVKQREAFTGGEGDAYHRRNRVGRGELLRAAEADPLLAELVALRPAPRTVLEVGAGNGWRLAALHERLPGVRCHGLDPSAEAVADGAREFPEVALVRGTAERLPFADRAFDLVALGFCLYLCDRDDLFRIAAETDRVLAEDGVVAVYDFHPDEPHRRAYAHAPGVHAWKMDHARLFSWNPAYRELVRSVLPHPGSGGDDPDDRVAVTLLRRSTDGAYPERPA